VPVSQPSRFPHTCQDSCPGCADVEPPLRPTKLAFSAETMRAVDQLAYLFPALVGPSDKAAELILALADQLGVPVAALVDIRTILYHP
jgi:hypothetical protein